MSNAISLQPVPEFNPDSGDVGASLATLWKKLLADFEMFTVAAGITDKTRKRALLLYQAGSRRLPSERDFWTTRSNRSSR